MFACVKGSTFFTISSAAPASDSGRISQPMICDTVRGEQYRPHVHVLAADGAFLPDGTLVPLPPVPEGLLVEGFRRAVLEFLVQHAAISGVLRFKLLGGRRKG